MIDGKLMVEGPAAAFAAGREAKVPYIAGGNSFEASCSRRPRRPGAGHRPHRPPARASRRGLRRR